MWCFKKEIMFSWATLCNNKTPIHKYILSHWHSTLELLFIGRCSANSVGDAHLSIASSVRTKQSIKLLCSCSNCHSEDSFSFFYFTDQIFIESLRCRTTAELWSGVSKYKAACRSLWFGLQLRRYTCEGYQHSAAMETRELQIRSNTSWLVYRL